MEEDKIDLDEKISAYMTPQAYFINESDGDRITVRQLLNQTGGLGTYQRFGNAKNNRELRSLNMQISNSWLVCGEIIEAVSGVSYSEYMNKKFFCL